jgi:hypothetical protein
MTTVKLGKLAVGTVFKYNYGKTYKNSATGCGYPEGPEYPSYCHKKPSCMVYPKLGGQWQSELNEWFPDDLEVEVE